MSAEPSPTPNLSGPLVIDASCVVGYLVVLTLADAATRLFHLAADGRVELWAPDLAYAECVSTLRKLVRIGAMGEAPAERSVGQLTELPITVTGTGALMPAVWRMRAFLTAYDACYVALADELGSPLVTGEQRLASELRKRGKPVHFLGDLA